LKDTDFQGGKKKKKKRERERGKLPFNQKKNETDEALSNFSVHLHKICELGQYHTEHVLVQEAISQAC
jgi:hypothetical protein